MSKQKPYIANGILVIPFDCPEKYKYWKKGQGLEKTLKELNVSQEIIDKYVTPLSMQGRIEIQ